MVRGSRLRPGEGIAGWVIRNSKSLVVPDTRLEEHHFKGVDIRTGIEMRSTLLAPLRVKDDVIGVLQVVDTEAGRFKEADLGFLEPLASNAAIVLGVSAKTVHITAMPAMRDTELFPNPVMNALSVMSSFFFM